MGQTEQERLICGLMHGLQGAGQISCCVFLSFFLAAAWTKLGDRSKHNPNIGMLIEHDENKNTA
eukprot:1161350-Pelagomonas_calceolata.AAC.23